VRGVLDEIRAVADRHQAQLEAENLRVGIGGSYAILVAECESIVKGALASFALVMAIVLASIVAFYREIRPVLALAGALAVGIASTFGLTWLVIGYLNTQTAFLGSIVAGTGVNYGLVYLARVTQASGRGAAATSQERSCGSLAACCVTSASARRARSFARVARAHIAPPAATPNGAPAAARSATSSVFCTAVPNASRPTKKKSAAVSDSQALRLVSRATGSCSARGMACSCPSRDTDTIRECGTIASVFPKCRRRA
jgi:hypothetical protein